MRSLQLFYLLFVFCLLTSVLTRSGLLFILGLAGRSGVAVSPDFEAVERFDPHEVSLLEVFVAIQVAIANIGAVEDDVVGEQETEGCFGRAPRTYAVYRNQLPTPGVVLTVFIHDWGQGILFKAFRPSLTIFKLEHRLGFFAK